MTDEEKAAEAAKAAAAKAAADAAAGGKPEPFATFETSEAFARRMEREARSILKAKGIDDVDKVKADLDELAKIRAAQAVEAEKNKSEIQRALEGELAAKQARATAEAAAEEAATKAHLYQKFAEQGIRNFDYAFYKVNSALAALPDGQELDEVKFIADLKADPANAAALGLAGAPAAAVTGATTTGAGAQPEAKPKEPGGGAPTQGDAFTKTPEQFRLETGSKYGFTPPV